MTAPVNQNQTSSIRFEEAQYAGYKKHKAFKISVKPRQPLELVNTKLIEQQSRPQSRKYASRASNGDEKLVLNESTTHKTTNSTTNNNDEPENGETLNATLSSTNHEEEEQVELERFEELMHLRNSFRPSTVRKVKRGGGGGGGANESNSNGTSRINSSKVAGEEMVKKSIVSDLLLTTSRSKSSIAPSEREAYFRASKQQQQQLHSNALSRAQTNLLGPDTLERLNTAERKSRLTENNLKLFDDIHYVDLNSESNLGSKLSNGCYTPAATGTNSLTNPKSSYISLSSVSNFQPTATQCSIFNENYNSRVNSSNLVTRPTLTPVENQMPANETAFSKLINNLSEEEFVSLLKENRLAQAIREATKENVDELLTPIASPTKDSKITLHLNQSRLLNHHHHHQSRAMTTMSATAATSKKNLNSNQQHYDHESSVRNNQNYVIDNSLESLKNVVNNYLANSNSNKAPQFYVNYLNNRFQLKTEQKLKQQQQQQQKLKKSSTRNPNATTTTINSSNNNNNNNVVNLLFSAENSFITTTSSSNNNRPTYHQNSSISSFANENNGFQRTLKQQGRSKSSVITQNHLNKTRTASKKPDDYYDNQLRKMKTFYFPEIAN